MCLLLKLRDHLLPVVVLSRHVASSFVKYDDFSARVYSLVASWLRLIPQ